MEPCYTSKLIILIDCQMYWREVFAHALRSAGFIVCTLDTYNYILPEDCLEGAAPDLVVLGCVCVRAEEQRLIAQILAYKHRLLVLCISLPWHVMRSLFIQGVDDIVDKPCNPDEVVSVVNQVLEITGSYQALERKSNHEKARTHSDR